MESIEVHTPDSTDGTENKPSRMERIWKTVYNAVSSPLGLTLLLIAYTFIGAAIFQAIEEPSEQEHRESLDQTRKRMVSTILNMSRGGDHTSINVTEKLLVYEKELEEAFLRRATSDIHMWDFWGSFFFCATVFTTIGYGHIAPATIPGRVATMVYAALGIPLCLIVLASLGKLLTWVFKYAWRFVVLSRVCAPCRRLCKTCRAKLSKCIRGSEATESNEEDDTGAKRVEEFKLPPVIAICIVILYIGLGTVIYVWEESWTDFEAFYFIFISISTIGFGDVLPEHPKYFLASSLYVLIGLALVAMVVNVIMEAMETTITVAKEKLDVAKVKLEVAKDKLEAVSKEKFEVAKEKLETVSKDIMDSAHKKLSHGTGEKDSGSKGSTEKV